MKRYMLFAGELYDPEGGFSDFMGFFDSVSEAEERSRSLPDHIYHPASWFQVVDTKSWKMVSASPEQRHHFSDEKVHNVNIRARRRINGNYDA